jgi:membrane protease YdiL (CAAX protease family)
MEEVCYRGLLQPAVARTLRSHVGAVAVTAVLFTVMHVPVIPAGSLWPVLVQLIALALVLGLIAARAGSVIPSIVVHATFNAVSIAVAVWGIDK